MLCEYLAWWRGRQTGGASGGSPDQPAAAEGGFVGHDARASSGALAGSAGEGQHAAAGVAADCQPLLYLKDWHFAAEHPEYQVPPPACTLHVT